MNVADFADAITMSRTASSLTNQLKDEIFPFSRLQWRSSMDRVVAARCFRVSAAAEGVPDFPDVLLAAAALPHGEREIEVDSRVVLRLERCNAAGPFLIGEFCRKQTSNVPPLAYEEGLAPINMPDGHGIGHVAAFLYHRTTRVIALQSNRQCATNGRISTYVSRRSPGSLHLLEAVLRRDAYERIHDRNLKRIQVRFASPENLDILEREGIAAGRAAKEVADGYNAETVEIIISAQRSDRSAYLNRDARGLISRLLRADVNIEKLDVKALTEAGLEDVDLLQEQLRFSDELDLPEADPDAHFRVRTAWMEEQFRSKLPTIEALFEQAGHGH